MSSTKKTLHEELFDKQQFLRSMRASYNQSSKREFSAKTPSLFVGSYNYPHMRIGLLNTEHYEDNDNPLQWVKKQLPLSTLVRLRSNLINAQEHGHTKYQPSPLAQKTLLLGQESAMAIKPLHIDVSLQNKPVFSMNIDQDTLPFGPSAQLKALSLTSNPKIPKDIDRVVSDTDLTSSAGLGQLWKKGYPEHQLTKLLSSGTLGTKLQRRVVPTKWSITAVDDTVGKHIIQRLPSFSEHDYQAHIGSYLGNYFLILFLPGPWSFELYENYLGVKNPHNKLSTHHHDTEGVRGRISYAHNTAGGYYASRLGVLEYLEACKKRASVITLRFISDEYWAPMGVWVVREAVRAALKTTGIACPDQESLLVQAQQLAQDQLRVDIQPLLQNSSVLATRRSQRTISDFS